MRTEYRGRGLIIYEKERDDLLREAVVAMARLDAGRLGDGEAAKVGALFDQWAPGAEYEAGMRISNESGDLYRVVQTHVSQADWPMEGTPALYTKLGVTVEEPEAIPEWVQPLGAADAYHRGDRVRYGGKVYRSTLDANVWAPDTTGWEEVVA